MRWSANVPNSSVKSVCTATSIRRGFRDLRCSTTIGSVVLAILVLNWARSSGVGEVDLETTVFCEVTAAAGSS